MFDTHCHLNFEVFKNTRAEVIQRANNSGVNYILVPGTDYETSQKAVVVANEFKNVYAAVGIHPHHLFKFKISNLKFENTIKEELKPIESLLMNNKVVAIGEVGIDKHGYKKTKYENYQIDEHFVESQKILLSGQIKLALKYNKSLIFHNWEAKEEFLEVINNCWDEKMRNKTVFHCCEADQELLEFAIKHQVYIGVDGDITYSKTKQEFIKKVPLELLVLETDSPYLTPEPIRTSKRFPNEPANIPIIANFISQLKSVPVELLKEMTTNNAKRLFSITL